MPKYKRTLLFRKKIICNEWNLREAEFLGKTIWGEGIVFLGLKRIEERKKNVFMRWRDETSSYFCYAFSHHSKEEKKTLQQFMLMYTTTQNFSWYVFCSCCEYNLDCWRSNWDSCSILSSISRNWINLKSEQNLFR
jgi:hypothetical protein